VTLSGLAISLAPSTVAAMRCASSYRLSARSWSCARTRRSSRVYVLQISEAGRGQDVARRRHFAVSHRKFSLDLLQGEAPTLRVFLGTVHIRHQLFGGDGMRLISELLDRCEQMQDVLIFDDVVAQFDALVADEDRRPGNELSHLVL
jgi:hypothetical protein